MTAKFLRRKLGDESVRYNETYMLTYIDDAGNTKMFTIEASSRHDANRKVTATIKDQWPKGKFSDLPNLLSVSVFSKKDQVVKQIYQNGLNSAETREQSKKQSLFREKLDQLKQLAESERLIYRQTENLPFGFW